MHSTVKCPFCDQTIQLIDSLRGRKVRCKCGQTFRMPGEKTSATEASVQATVAARPKPPEPEKSRIKCDGCATVFEAQPSMAGRSFKCKCGNTIAIPGASLPVESEPVAATLVTPPGMPPMASPVTNAAPGIPQISLPAVDQQGFSVATPVTPVYVDPLGAAPGQPVAPFAAPAQPAVANPYWKRQKEQKQRAKESEAKERARRKAARDARTKGFKTTPSDNTGYSLPSDDGDGDGAMMNIVVGGVFFFGGLAVTIGSYTMASESGGTYVVAWGAVLFGGIQFLRGLMQLAGG